MAAGNATLGTALRIASNYNGTTFYNGRIFELLLSNTNLGSTARANIESYFTSRYGYA